MTEEKFKSYLYVQISGSVNMNQLKLVSELTGLTIEEIRDIQNNYSCYNEQFKGLKEEIEQELLETLTSE